MGRLHCDSIECGSIAMRVMGLVPKVAYLCSTLKLANETVKAFVDFYWRGAPGPSSSATQGRRSRTPIASYCDGPFSPKKINLISCGTMSHVSDIKLIRTDTTLDLSQKAEKGML